MNEKTESPLENKDKRRQPIALNVRCGSCIFFEDRAHQAFKKPCSTLGVKKFSRPCIKFFANPFHFLQDDPEYKLVNRLLVKYGKQLPTLVAWLNQESSTKKTGFTFGQTVYVRMLGDDYLLNYAKATVISSSKEQVYVQGKKLGKGGTYLHDSVLTEEQWSRKKKNLIKHKRIRDPKEKEYYKITVTPKKAVDYEIPTIDQFAKTMSKVKDKKTNSRVIIVK
jgi:hypothetical protein